MTSLQGCRVTVVGARGFGKHHTKWRAAQGAEAVAFTGTSRGFAGKGVERLGKPWADFAAGDGPVWAARPCGRKRGAMAPRNLVLGDAFPPFGGVTH